MRNSMTCRFHGPPHDIAVRSAKRGWRQITKPDGTVVNVRAHNPFPAETRRRHKLQKMIERRAAQRQRKQEREWAKLAPTPQERWLDNHTMPPGARTWSGYSNSLEEEFRGSRSPRKPKALYPA
jgi:hypothetical protein